MIKKSKAASNMGFLDFSYSSQYDDFTGKEWRKDCFARGEAIFTFSGELHIIHGLYDSI